MESEARRYQDVGVRIYNLLICILDIFILLAKLLSEIIISTCKIIIGEEESDVSGEIVLITGTGHGIGRELALQYVSLGSTVVCVDINEAGNLETVSAANEIRKGSAHSYICDVSQREKVLELAEKVESEIGTVTILVNNCGIMPTHSIQDHTANEIRKIFDINVLAQFWTIEAFLPGMKAKNHGHIVALSSIAGLVGLSNLVPYCASKFAVRGLMEALHDELREQNLDEVIQVTAIFPYMVNTGLCKKPKVKFPSLLPLLEPKDTAKSIIKAQRLRMKMATVPRSLMHVNKLCRLLPYRGALHLKDFIGSGVESDM